LRYWGLPFAPVRSVHLAGQTNTQAQAPAGFPAWPAAFAKFGSSARVKSLTPVQTATHFTFL